MTMLLKVYAIVDASRPEQIICRMLPDGHELPLLFLSRGLAETYQLGHPEIPVDNGIIELELHNNN